MRLPVSSLLPALALIAACSPDFSSKDNVGPSDSVGPGDSADTDTDTDSDSDSDSDSDTDSDTDTDTDSDSDTDTAVDTAPDTSPDTSALDTDGDGSPDDVDCDPADPSVHPGAPEIWYDGLDSDCAGDDDYDQDHDGYQNSAYGGTDCIDVADWAHPGATDAWYDGVDADCLGNDDYDQDGDAYDDPSGGGTDCDDLDPAVNPEGTEVLGDATDGDCNGSDDGPAFVTLSTYAGTGLQGPRIAETSDSLLIGVIADSFVDGASVYTTGSFISILDVDDMLGGVTAGLFSDWGGSATFDDGVDFAADDDYWVLAYGLHFSTERWLVGDSYRVATNTSAGSGISRTTSQTFDDVELSIDPDGSYQVVGCDSSGGILTWLHGAADELFIGGGVITDDISGYSSDACLVWEGDTQIRTSHRSGSYLQLVDYGDSIGLVAAGTSTGWTVYDMEGGRFGLHDVFVATQGASGVYVEDNGSAATLSVATADQVDVDGEADGTLYIVATDGTSRAWLYWGSVATGFSSVELATDLTRIDDIDVHLTARSQLVIAARGGNDVTYGVVAAR